MRTLKVAIAGVPKFTSELKTYVKKYALLDSENLVDIVQGGKVMALAIKPRRSVKSARDAIYSALFPKGHSKFPEFETLLISDEDPLIVYIILDTRYVIKNSGLYGIPKELR